MCTREFDRTQINATFKCLPTVELEDRDIIMEARKKYYTDYCFFYDKTRNVPRDLKQPESLIDSSFRDLVTPEENQHRFNLWEPIYGRPIPSSFVKVPRSKKNEKNKIP